MTRFIIFVSFFVVLSAPLRATDCNFKYSKNAKTCPNSGTTLLDDTYPVSTFVISIGPFRKTSASKKVPEEFIIQTLKNYDFSKDAPNIIIPTYEEDFNELKDQLVNRIKSSNGEIPNHILDKIIFSPSKPYTWQQDYFESFFDSNTGKPVLRYLASYREKQGERIAHSGASCGITQGPPVTSDLSYENGPDKSFRNGEMGGNIEGLPGGLCLVGDNLSSKVSSEFCGGANNVVQIDVSWLRVGHVDEVVKVIPTQRPGVPSECNFSLTFASPQKALDLLSEPKDLNQPFLSGTFLNSKSNTEDINEFRASRGSEDVGRRLCQIFYDSNQKRSKPPSKNKDGSATKAYLKIKNLFLNSAYAGLSVKIEQKSESESECRLETLTNSEFLTSIKEDSMQEDYLSYNKLVQEKMNESKTKIVSNILKKLPQCEKYIDVLDVPDLFYGTLAESDNGKQSLPLPGNGGSFIPNPTNSVVAGKGVIFSDPQNPLFRNYLEDELKKRGMKSSFIDTWDYAHLGDGNLHCSSHSIPYCRPRELGIIP